MGILNIGASAEMTVSSHVRANTTAGKLAGMRDTYGTMPVASETGVIQEVSEENISMSQSVKKKVQFDGEPRPGDALLKTYQRVDQGSMRETGLGHKADMTSESGAL